jgi:multiple sugar transport system permease protein
MSSVVANVGHKPGPGLTRTVVYHVGVIAFGFVMLYPLLWMVSSSFKASDEIFTNVTSLIPRRFTLDNYAQGWAGFGGIPFITFFRNSLFYSVVGTLLVVCSSAITAYGFARLRFVGQRFWFTMMLLTLMLPIQVQVIPEYILFTKLGFLNTFWPLLLPRIGGQAFFIFMIMQFIRGIPRELDEAARIDGCGHWQIFRRVMLPLMGPALGTTAIFTFIWTWSDFFTPLIYLTDPYTYTVPVALRSFLDATTASNWGAMFAMSVVTLIPLFLAFLFGQRFLVKGIATTGGK